jgi:hypothetical protein
MGTVDMRVVMMLFGLILVGLAGLWFFTPVLDQTYARHAPGLAHARSPQAKSTAPSGSASAPRSIPQASGSSQSAAAGGIASKNVLDNVMSMINAGTGLLGLWFGWMSYRLQKRDAR